MLDAVPSAPPETSDGISGSWVAIAGLLVSLAIVGIVLFLGSRPGTVRAKASAPSDTQSAASPSRGLAMLEDRPIHPAAAIGYSRTGANAFNSGNVEAAIEQLTSAVEADPNDAAALDSLGQALVRAQRTSEAIDYFDRAVERSPATWAYHFDRARAYAELQSWRQAIDGYEEAAKLFPEDYATRYNLAMALEADGDLPGAIESYQKAVTLAPGQLDLLLSLAATQEFAQRWPEAAATYRRYLELKPAAPDADKIKDRIARLVP